MNEELKDRLNQILDSWEVTTEDIHRALIELSSEYYAAWILFEAIERSRDEVLSRLMGQIMSRLAELAEDKDGG
jgi:hypothetical protein